MYSNIVDTLLVAKKDPFGIYPVLIMAALRSRCGHYIFAPWFLLLSFFSLPNLSVRIVDVYHTSTHLVALMRI